MSPLLEQLRAALTGRYRVERELARGGMATVFLAEDEKHRRPVAIKVFSGELSAMLGAERFRREIEFAARLQHPHILTLLDSGAEGGLLYYVMPYVVGESLRARLDREGQLPIEEAARLATEVGRALDYAHRQGIVHRDIKPENILLADGQAMIADFGIARAITAAGGEQLTRSGIMVGTAPYMSPEQVSASADLDGRSDQYSLGCVLYEMLAGQPPFGGVEASVTYQHINVAPRPVTQLRPAVPAALDAAVQRALAKTPADRYATAARFAEAMAPAVTAAAPGTAPAVVPKARARPWPWLAAAALAVVALIVIGRSVLGRRTPASSERQWVWVASFEGPASDSTLAPAARDLIASALDESGILATVPEDQERIALRNAGREGAVTIDEALARQLAFRSGIGVVVSGKIAQLGGGYRIALRAVGAETGEVLLAPAGNAAGSRDLIPVLSGLARDLRRGLGERPEVLRPRSGGVDAVTSSFEAFKLYAAGRRQINAGENTLAIPLFRQALAIDPTFAAAYGGLGTAFANTFRFDSARVAYEQALRYPDRLGEAKRLDILAKIDKLDGKTEQTLTRYDAMIALDPTPGEKAVALHNKGGALFTLGRYDEALEFYRRAAATWPVESTDITNAQIVSSLIAMGRMDEARREAAQLEGMQQEHRMELAANDKRWATVDSAAAAMRGQPGLGGIVALLAHASAISAMGRIAESRRALADVETLVQRDAPFLLAAYWWGPVLMELAAGRDPGAVMPSASLPRRDAAALRAIWVGDSAGAHRSFVPNRGDAEAASRIAAAWRDRRHERWSQVIERLAPMARIGYYDPEGIEQIRQTSRWLVADAFLARGEPDSASTYLGLMLEPPGRSADVVIGLGMIEPWVRARRIHALARGGRLDAARREWETLSATATQPDAEMLALLDETRATLQAAEAMHAAGRR